MYKPTASAKTYFRLLFSEFLFWVAQTSCTNNRKLLCFKQKGEGEGLTKVIIRTILNSNWCPICSVLLCSAHIFSFPVFIQVIDVMLWSLISINSEPISWQFLAPSSLQESHTVNAPQSGQYQAGPRNSHAYGNLQSCIWMPPWDTLICRGAEHLASPNYWRQVLRVSDDSVTPTETWQQDQRQHFNSLYISNHLLATCIRTKIFLFRKLPLPSF